MAIFPKLFNKWAIKRMPKGREVELNTNCTFVVPTKAGLAFMLLLVTILLVGINYQNNLAYGLCFILSSVTFLAIIHTCRNLAAIKVSNVGCSPVFAAESVSFRIQLEVMKGATRQAIGLRWVDVGYDESITSMQLVDIDKLAGAELLLNKIARKRGIFKPGRIYLETQFPLGLFVSWTEIDLLFKVIVYPKPVEGALSTIGHSSDEEEGVHSFGRGVDDFQGLRTYQPGDSKRLINWKSFSKGQGLFVRDFTALVGKDPWLDYDFVEGSVEHRLSVLCYWVLEMSQQQRPFGLKLPDIELLPATGDKHKQAALSALALFGISQ